jgi:glycosyltransferase involved in cell wall biosynthesis
MKAIAVCTIVAKNYLALAKTLGQSLHRFHPEIDFRISIVDLLQERLDAAETGKFLVDPPVDYMDRALLNKMAYGYEITEFNTSVKPFYVEYLFNQGYEKVIYLDPDIWVMQPLDAIFTSLDADPIVLTPHLLDPIPFDQCVPNELSILQSGAYNLGFLGVRRSPLVERFLTWWQERLAEYCIIAPERGIFVDQKWVDLVPGMFGGVTALRDRGYNVAYWNLNARQITYRDGEYWIDQDRLKFFHFSGFNADKPQNLSKHQDRIKPKQRPALDQLLSEYAQALKANGHERYKQWPYGYGRFSNQQPFDDTARSLLKRAAEAGLVFTDPANADPVPGEPASSQGPSFYQWLNQPVPGAQPTRNGEVLTHYLLGFYQRRPDLQAAYPDLLSQHCDGFLSWVKRDGLQQKIPAAFVAAAVTPEAAIPGPESYRGINIAGYLTAESGVGEAARGYVAAFQSAGRDVALLDVSSQTLSRQGDTSLSGFSLSNPHPVNLVCINADQVPNFIVHAGAEYFTQKYSIGLWAWELPSFPPQWRDRFNYFNEIWVGSQFMAQALVQQSPVPVLTVPHRVEISLPRAYSKAEFGLPEDFTFLFIFDFLSVFERKNPLALVQAFRQAFRPHEPVQLVIKCINGDRDPVNDKALQESIAGAKITLMQDYLSRDDKNGLLSVCDAYVSLHCAEGFGLTLAEAMLLGKPVVATGWSGNMDFMTVNNSYPVEYDLVEIQEDCGPYPQGSVWANPRLAHAAQLLRQIYEQPQIAQQKGDRARQDIATHHCAGAIAEIANRRLDWIDLTQVQATAPLQTQPLLLELQRTRQRLIAIETSKFWKLRKQWFKLKRRLGLPDNE